MKNVVIRYTLFGRKIDRGIRFDYRQSYKKRTTENRTEKHTEERQQVPTFVRFPTVLALLDSPFFLLDELHCYMIDCLLTPTYDMRRLVWLLLSQRRMTGPKTILTKKRSYIGKYVMIAFLKPWPWEIDASNIFLYALNSSLSSF